jgi:EAL domain-containing protein (putative c-di-GMP-specific phosphodiesterase class I)
LRKGVSLDESPLTQQLADFAVHGGREKVSRGDAETKKDAQPNPKAEAGSSIVCSAVTHVKGRAHQIFTVHHTAKRYASVTPRLRPVQVPRKIYQAEFASSILFAHRAAERLPYQGLEKKRELMIESHRLRELASRRAAMHRPNEARIDGSRLFHLYEQPIVSSNGSSGTMVEILLAMADQAGRVINASKFLEPMQGLGMTAWIDRFVVQSVVSALEERERKGLSPLHFCGVNLAGPSVCDREFEQFLDAQLARIRHPEQICFEITETIQIPDIRDAADRMSRIKKWGCTFALDDFGDGLCSYSYLKHLPIDVIKIDGQFVRDCSSSPLDREIVASIHRVGSLLKVPTIAECVENECVRDVVNEIGVQFLQGHLFGTPRPCSIGG